MGEEKAVGHKIIIVPKAGLEGGKGLLVVLQRVEVLPRAAVRKAKC